MRTKPISFRLRKGIDEDLMQAVEHVSEHDLSNLCRDGLRLMLGIRTTRKLSVREEVLILPLELNEKASKDNPC